jgi:hypothetical protein
VSTGIKGSRLLVCVCRRGGDPAFGVLVGRDVVAVPVEHDVDFDSTPIDVLITTLPPRDGVVEWIAADRVDVVAPEKGFGGSSVAFVTLAGPSRHYQAGRETSSADLQAAIEETGDLWSAVRLVCGGIDSFLDHPAEALAGSEEVDPLTVNTVVVRSPMDAAWNICDLLPTCLPGMSPPQ